MLLSVLARALAAACFVASSFAVVDVVDETPAEMLAVASFGELNPFNHVTNGQMNLVNVTVENHSGTNVTLTSIAGSVHRSDDKGTLIKNLTSLSYGLFLIEKGKVTLPYRFHSEYKTGDASLKLWVEYTAGESKDKLRVVAYDSTVTVVEPPASWFDIKLYLTYLIAAAVVGGVGYVGFQSFWPGRKGKKRTTKKTRTKTAPGGVPEVLDTPPIPGSGQYSEDWIPAHHLKHRKKADGALSSGDERSGPSGPESSPEKRRGRKK